MKRKSISLLIISILIFIFIIFYKGLDDSNFYKPKSKILEIPQFFSKNFYINEEIDSKKIFDEDRYYLFNIWASWCIPCRDEHPMLIDLSKNQQLSIIGLNYKDKLANAKRFLEDLGDPYEKILIDQDGTISIEWGAIGVPETFLIYQNRIVKKFMGPLNENSLIEIQQIIK